MDDSRAREIEKTLRELRGEVDGLASNITRLVKAIEQDDYLRERAERAEDKERDERYEKMTGLLDDLVQRVEGVGVAMRDLPRLCVEHVERLIGDLRKARWDALQAGVQNEAPLLPPTPGRREPTDRQQALQPRDGSDESTGPFATHHRSGAKRQVHEMVGSVVVWGFMKSWKILAATSAGAAIIQALHKLGIL